MEGFIRISQNVRIKSTLDSINKSIIKDIDSIQNTIDKTKIDSISINNNINYYKNTLSSIKNSLYTAENISYYSVVNGNLIKLQTIFNLVQNGSFTYSTGNNYSTTTSNNTTATTTATSGTSGTSSTSGTTSNIPNSTPVTNTSNTGNITITSNDISTLFTTVEGFTPLHMYNAYSASSSTLKNCPQVGGLNMQKCNTINKNNINDYISSYYINMPIIEGLNDTDMTNITTLMNKEKELVDQLADFNIKYERYIHCSDPTPNSDCGANEPTSEQLITKMDTINGIINSMKSKKELPQTINYQSNHNSILNDYDKVVNLRNDLDMKVKQLYDPENSKIVDFKYAYDSTIYSGIIISALATSLLYYIFTEL